jgi:hypothetical protein
LHGDRAIIRQNSITNATKLYTDSQKQGTITDYDAASDVIIALARKFEAYSCGDLDAAMAEQMKESAE